MSPLQTAQTDTAPTYNPDHWALSDPTRSTNGMFRATWTVLLTPAMEQYGIQPTIIADSPEDRERKMSWQEQRWASFRFEETRADQVLRQMAGHVQPDYPPNLLV